MYSLIKFAHQLCAFASFTLFAVRGVWMLRDAPQLSRRWVRILPHVVDTLLLASAIALTLMLHQYPLTHAWLSAKVLALLAYIGLGLIALHYGRSRRVRAAAWIGAMTVFAYIVSVALSHDARGFFRIVM
ncbi:MAG: regulator SirB [Betaproteobacteria bacterium]|nr:MAG: regulator SirB [Betaproteobacteria bacterium]